MIKYVTWEDVEKFISNIEDIHKRMHFTGVYGIARGGLVPATMISYRLRIPLLMAPCSGCLIVDDITDTGNSLSHYLLNNTNENKYFTATIYYSPYSTVKPDYFMNMKQEEWIVFPWEKVINPEGKIKS